MTDIPANPAPDQHPLPPLEATPTGLYRHHKGAWYEVLDTVRCSETLQGMTVYRALYGEFGLWVRPSAMFNGLVPALGANGQPRFVRHPVSSFMVQDLASARALVAHLQGRAQRQGVPLQRALRPPPPEPTSCCGRGCQGCVWLSHFEAVQHWRTDALAVLAAASVAQKG